MSREGSLKDFSGRGRSSLGKSDGVGPYAKGSPISSSGPRPREFSLLVPCWPGSGCHLGKPPMYSVAYTGLVKLVGCKATEGFRLGSGTFYLPPFIPSSSPTHLVAPP